MNFKNLLSEPAFDGLENGSPEWFATQKKVILSRPLIKHHYDLWYALLLADAQTGKKKGTLIEIGSGGSYLQSLNKNIITSDVLPGIADRVIDATTLPFKKNSVQAYFLTHVFHHIPDIEKFLREAERTLVPGGVISIIDTTNTLFGHFFYKHFHPEPHEPTAKKWLFDWGHNMEDSNQALTWVVFVRDKKKFEKQFPELIIEHTKLLPWLSYILSGGVTRKNLIPKIFIPLLKGLDRLLIPLNVFFALSWHITIRKNQNSRKHKPKRRVSVKSGSGKK